jgi:4-carboxymuconolactone decarboxylase
MRSDADRHGGPVSEPTPIQLIVGDVAPKIAELTDGVLFGDVWERPELSSRDRSLVTISALIMGGNTEQLRSHLRRGLDNGLTREEIGETLTHLAFYAGWPRALSAVAVARAVFEEIDRTERD